MKRLLYLDGCCGISGDMTVAALLDLGASREKLDAALQPLTEEGVKYAVSRRESHGISGCDFDVDFSEAAHHCEDHSGHEHRNLFEVNAVIDRLKMSVAARKLAKRIFAIIAAAEAEAHGCPVTAVHFHEVGALDSIADVVGAAVLFDDLNVSGCVVTGLTEGSGFVRCQHGELPVPVPAVLNIARAEKIVLRASNTQGEMVTPTGIAVAAALRTENHLPSEYLVRKVGVGLGKRDFGRANILRAMLIEEPDMPESIFVVETDIDDATGEMLGRAMEELFAAGALDVHAIPCFMKKNRPAYQLQAVVPGEKLAAVEEAVFRTTTSIGLRKHPVERTRMEREAIVLHLPFGDVAAKKCAFSSVVRCYPEYESVKCLAETTGIAFRTVYEEAKRAAAELANEN